MENLTVANTQNVETVISTALKQTLDDIKKRCSVTLFVQTEFRCMEGFITLPKEVIENSYLTESAKDYSSKTTGQIAVKGEVFSAETLKPLADIRTRVNKKMQEYGILVGTAGSFLVFAKDRKKIRDFLENCIQEYTTYLDSILRDYDLLVADQVEKLKNNIKDPVVLKSLLDKIPSSADIKARNICSYTFYNESVPSIDDALECSHSIATSLQKLESRDKAFFEKITYPFKEFARCFEAKESAHVLGRKESSFNKAVAKALISENTTKAVLAGTKYERYITKAYELIHLLELKLCQSLSAKVKSAYTKQILDVYKNASYILSSAQSIMDYADGKIACIDKDFVLGGECPLIPDTISNTADAPIANLATEDEVQNCVTNSTDNTCDTDANQESQDVITIADAKKELEALVNSDAFIVEKPKEDVACTQSLEEDNSSIDSANIFSESLFDSLQNEVANEENSVVEDVPQVQNQTTQEITDNVEIESKGLDLYLNQDVSDDRLKDFSNIYNVNADNAKTDTDTTYGTFNLSEFEF